MPVLTHSRDPSSTPPARWYLRRLRELRPADTLLLAETALLLLAARFALAVLPVRFIFAWKRRTSACPSGDLLHAAQVERCRRVSWAVQAVARRSPVRLVCFPQALAAHALLSAAGIRTHLHYGARRNTGKLETHAWLEAGGLSIVGGDAAQGFTSVAVY